MVLTLNTNIRLPLFWSLSSWSRANLSEGPGPGYMCWPGAWAVIIAVSVVLPQSKGASKGLANVFP